MPNEGIPVGEDARRTILGCDDPMVMQTWLKRALTAQTTDEILRPIG